MSANRVIALYGIYNADGGLRGELSYVAGRLFGATHCELCNITHSPVRRKKAWDEFILKLGIPFTLLHRNELVDAPTVIREAGVNDLPCVVALSRDESAHVVLGPGELAVATGDVDAFGLLLQERLDALS